MSDGDSSPAKVMNRWLVVVGALLIQLSLGALYAWSVFTPALKDPQGAFRYTNAQTQIIFSVGLATFAVVMVLAGIWQKKVGPRLVSLVGGLVLGAGYISASFVGSSFPLLILTIGVIGGAGIGLAYVCPIAVGMKWFPDKKGLITGLAVAGFGFGALIWIKLAGQWGHLIANIGVSQTFLVYGIAFLVAVVLGSFFMVNPPDGWKPAGWTPPVAGKAAGGSGAVEFTSGQMLATPQFYGLWLAFIFSSMAGLMVIGIIALFGIDALMQAGKTKEEATAIAGTAMAVFYSIANGLGRIIWGKISDSIGRKVSIVAMTLLQGITMLAFYYMAGTPGLFYLGAAVIGFNFGGNFALFPTATADYFGTKNVGSNYGWVFTAYGVGGIVGPIMAGYIKDEWKNFHTAFIIAGVACLAASVIAMVLRPPVAAGRTVELDQAQPAKAVS